MPTAHEDGFFSARDGLRLYYQRWDGAAEPGSAPPAPRAILALVHGYLEHGGRYNFFVDHFTALGYRVYSFDHRGHGRSAGHPAHCDRFSDYLLDVDRYLATIQEREGDERKIFLVGHSMGGLVSLRFAIESPEGLAGVIASSPYLGNRVPISSLQLYAAKVLSRVWPTLAMKAPDLPVSRDPAVVRAYAEDPLVGRRYTVRWSAETLAAQAATLQRASELRIPCLLLQGGADSIADPAVTRAFFERLTTPDRELKVYEGFYHEIFNDLGREEVFRDVEEWLRKRL